MLNIAVVFICSSTSAIKSSIISVEIDACKSVGDISLLDETDNRSSCDAVIKLLSRISVSDNFLNYKIK